MKNKILLTYKNVVDYCKIVVCKWSFIVPVILTLGLSYGFSLTNRSISIDDLAQTLYYGSSNYKITIYRWGQTLINRLFSTNKYYPFANQFIGIIFLVLTAIIIGTIFYKYDKNKDKTFKYTLVTCIFVSFPLINEFWSFYECLTIPVCYFIVSVCVLFQITNEEISVLEYVLIGLVMSIVMSGYESLIFTYSTLVLIYLYFEYGYINYQKGWFKKGLSFILPLIFALVFRYLIGYVVILLLNPINVDKAYNATKIVWLDAGASVALKNIAYNGWYYFIRAVSYLPIGEFVIFLICGIVIFAKNQKSNKNSMIIGILIIISIFFLSFIQGTKLQYRTAQSVYLFVAFIVYLILEIRAGKKFETIIYVILCFVTIRQSIYMNKIQSLNNQRSENEMAVVYNIGYQLTTNYDLNKTVVFCGDYDMGDFIEEELTNKENSFGYLVENKLRDNMGHEETPKYYEFVDSNVNSVLNWSRKSFDGQTMMKELFSYCGFNIKTDDSITNENSDLLEEHYLKIAEENQMNPLSIKEFDSYILVYLGPSLSLD